MCTAVEEIIDFTVGVSWEAFAGNKLLRYAVERQLLVIGEAASHVSESFRQKHPEIPWLQIIG